MVGLTACKIELSTEEHRILLDAQKVWQEIESYFDDMGADICYITDAMDTKLSDLLDACENGIMLEH